VLQARAEKAVTSGGAGKGRGLAAKVPRSPGANKAESARANGRIADRDRRARADERAGGIEAARGEKIKAVNAANRPSRYLRSR